jgi:hypothetical protein
MSENDSTPVDEDQLYKAALNAAIDTSAARPGATLQDCVVCAILVLDKIEGNIEKQRALIKQYGKKA